jgi:hypothetical protein
MTYLDTQYECYLFYGKVVEFSNTIEQFFAKAKCCGFMDLLLGKFFILKTDENFDEVSDIGKTMTRNIKLNEIGCVKPILSIDVQASYGKIT